MNRLLLFCICFLCALSYTKIIIKKEFEQNGWDKYKLNYELKFNETEDERRKKIYMKNVAFVKENNAKNTDFILEINKFAHLKVDEIPRCYFIKNYNLSPEKIYNITEDDHELPLRQSIDYRDFGIVGPVKDQGKCGSCYAFSAIGSLQSNLALRTGRFLELSEQNIVDCSRVSGNNGCRGGTMDFTFDYIRKYGISTDRTYPYVGHDKKCLKKLKIKPVEDWVDIPSGNENGLIRVLSFIGPASIAIDASSKEFLFYKSGILNTTQCSSDTDMLNHAVLAIGYKLKDSPYLIVKNSWGTDWGDHGYVKIALYSGNMCGVASQASYPIIIGDHSKV